MNYAIASSSDLNIINEVRSEYQEALVTDFDIQNENGYVTFLDFINGELVGYLSLSPEVERSIGSGEVFLSIFYKKDYCGLGYGTKLIKHAIKYCNSSTLITCIKLAVSPKNERAFKLYSSLGFNGVINKKQHLCPMTLVCKNT